MVTKTAFELKRLVREMTIAVGTPEEDAAVLSDILVGSHLAGHDSHGIQNLPGYIKEVQTGQIVPSAKPEIIQETPSAVLVRGNWGWGHLTAEFVTRLGIKKAKENGVALLTAVEINHIGRVGDYSERAAGEGILTLLWAGGIPEMEPSAVPHGGSRVVLGPNPIAMGFPTGDSHPVVIDFATTKIAGGKVTLAQAKGEQVPPGCIIDEQGNPTTDPDALLQGGALLPFGGHKGFGIMVATEILGRILPGADAYSETPHGSYYRHQGMSLVAIESGLFSTSSQFADRTTALVRRIQDVPSAPGFSDVMAPGDFENRAREQRKEQGIQIPDSTWEKVSQTAQLLGLTID